MYDGGKMDGADMIPCAPSATSCAAYPNPQFMYVNPSDVQPYFSMAEQYTFGDRMFQTNQGPSFPAHQFIISGTSAPTATSDLFAAENLSDGNNNAGCIGPTGTTVVLIDPNGSESSNAPTYPCFEHPTLTDLLDAKGISWRYYAPSAGLDLDRARTPSSTCASRKPERRTRLHRHAIGPTSDHPANAGADGHRQRPTSRK